jgi:hypothetical protein
LYLLLQKTRQPMHVPIIDTRDFVKIIIVIKITSSKIRKTLAETLLFCTSSEKTITEDIDKLMLSPTFVS